MLYHLGWDGTGTHTIAETGKKFGISGQRASFIINAFLSRLASRKRQRFPRTLDKALAVLQNAAGETPARAQDALAAEGLTPDGFKLEGILRAAELLGRDPGVAIEQVGRERLLMTPRLKDLSAAALTEARQAVQRLGVAQSGELFKQRNEPERRLALRALEAQPDFQWLDQPAGWFRFSCASVRRKPVLGVILKILAVAGPIQMGEIQTVVNSYFERLHLTESAVLALCRTLAPIKFDAGRRLVADPPIPLEAAFRGAELALVKALSQARRPMTRPELREASGLQSLAAWSWGDRSPVIVRSAWGVYHLLGRSF